MFTKLSRDANITIIYLSVNVFFVMSYELFTESSRDANNYMIVDLISWFVDILKMVECLCWSTRLLPWRSCYTQWIDGVLRMMSGLYSGRSCPSSYRGTTWRAYSSPWSRPSGRLPVGCSQCRSVCFDKYQILWILGTNNWYFQSYSSAFNSFYPISNLEFGKYMLKLL